MFLGIEIGGTKLQLGVGSGDGALAGFWRAGVSVADGAEGICRQIAAAVPQLLLQSGVAAAEVKAIGVGFGGPVDDATQRVIKSHQIAGWGGFPLADWAGRLLGVPAVLGNDADLAGLAEAHFGAAKGRSPVFYVTVGSGIGGGLIVDGTVYRGTGKGAAEIGHLRVADGTLVLEEVASGWAIERQAAAVFGQPRKTAEVVQAAVAGDPKAQQIIDRAWTALAEAFCHVIALLCPRIIVLGGGVSLIGEQHLFEPLRKLVAERVFRPFANCYEIVPARLGEEVVIHGALALARQRSLFPGEPPA